jgi:hypothetical protein
MDNFRKQVTFNGTEEQIKKNPAMKALMECLKEYEEKTKNDKNYPNIFVGVQANEEMNYGILHFLVEPKS